MRSRAGVVVLVALVPLVALALDPAGWYPFGPSKWLVVSTVLPAGFALLVWSRPLRWVRSITIASVALVGWLALAAVFGHDASYAWVGTPERHLGVLTWGLCALALVAGQTLDPEHDRDAVAWSLTIAALAVGAAATVEALGFEPDVFAVTSGRLTATMGSAAYLGALAALLLPAVVGAAVDVRLGRRLRVAAAVGGGLMVVACIGSGARAAWFGLAVAAAVAVIARRRWLLAHRRAAGVGLLTGAAVVVAVVVLSPAGSRLASSTDADAPGGRSRLDEWQVASRVIGRHPVVGVGPEGYRIAFAEGTDDAYERAHGRDPLPDRAHSGPLDVALDGGLPALLAWGVIVGLVLRAAWRALRADRGWLAGIAAGLVAHFAGQLLLFPTAELEPVAWLLAGLLVVATSPTSDIRERTVARPMVAALGVVALVAVVAGGRDVAADRRAETAVEAAARGDHDAAVDDAAEAVDLRSDEVRLHLLLARMLVDADRGTRPALAAVDDALDVSPRDPIVRLEQARLLVRRAGSTHLPDDVAAARDAVAAMLHADDANADLWLLAGAAAEMDGDVGGAESAFRRSEDLAPRSAAASIELALLHLDEGDLGQARDDADRALARAPDDARGQEVSERVDQARADARPNGPS